MPFDAFKSTSHTTPAGIVGPWAKVHEPDTKFKAEGEYSIKLRFKGADAEKMKAYADAAVEEAKAAFAEDLAAAKAKKNPAQRAKMKEFADPPYQDVYDEGGKLTGETEFKFSMKASGKYAKGPKAGQGYTRSPKVFNALGQPLESCPEIGQGSRCRVSFRTSGYYTDMAGVGAKLNLEAVQIIELKQFGGGGGSASSFGFGAEDGGFTDTEVDAPAPKAKAAQQQEGPAADAEDIDF